MTVENHKITSDIPLHPSLTSLCLWVGETLSTTDSILFVSWNFVNNRMQYYLIGKTLPTHSILFLWWKIVNDPILFVWWNFVNNRFHTHLFDEKLSTTEFILFVWWNFANNRFHTHLFGETLPTTHSILICLVKLCQQHIQYY